MFRSRASLQAEVLTLRQQLNAAAEGTGETSIPERAIGHQMQKKLRRNDTQIQLTFIAYKYKFCINIRSAALTEAVVLSNTGGEQRDLRMGGY